MSNNTDLSATSAEKPKMADSRAAVSNDDVVVANMFANAASATGSASTMVHSKQTTNH